jgi:hypothetical protein
MVVWRSGRVVEVEVGDDEQIVTVAFTDGTTARVAAPAMVEIAAGAHVKQVDVGDGKPIYSWG